MLMHHDARGYEVAASEAAREARAKMEAIIAKGRGSAIQVFEAVHRDVPEDRIVRGRALRFGYAAPAAFLGDPALAGVCDADGIPVQVAAVLDQDAPMGQPADDAIPALVLEVADKTEKVHSHALAQIAGKANVPSKYLRELVESSNPKLRELAVRILETHYGQTEIEGSRFLLRSVHEQVRGFLSDRYRRLDNRPLLDAFGAACAELGAVPADGTVSDTRIMIKAYLPTIFEPVAHEVMMLGLALGNSDFGAAALTCSLTVNRLWCTNKAIMCDSLRHVHLGRRLDETINYSEQTYALDTAANVSALRDTVHDLLSPARVNALQAAIRTAAEQQVDWRQWSAKVAALLTKKEMETAHTMFDASDDVVTLPAGKSVWRASNVLSWLAGTTEDPDRRLDLERAAGQLIDGFMPKAA